MYKMNSLIKSRQFTQYLLYSAITLIICLCHNKRMNPSIFPRHLVVMLPALNEAMTITSVIKQIPRQIPGIATIDVLVIDDGSTDQTATLAKEAGTTVVQHHKTLGVGAAFHTGLSYALAQGADILVNIDADGQFSPQDIPKLIEPILQGKAEFVTASRFARPELEPAMPVLKRWGNRCMVRLINLITGQTFTDVSCGFRAYTRETALRLTLFGHFTYTQESFIDLAYKNVPMAEVPLAVQGVRSYGRSRVADNLWRYGLKTATIIFRTARDYYPFYFFGVPGLILFGLGGLSGSFLLNHFIRTGQTFPYRSLVQVSSVLLILGFLLFFISMLADMFHRNRQLQEQTLYLLRKHIHGRHKQS